MPRCKYHLEISAEEADAMDWLGRVLDDMAGKKGRNRGRAEALLGFIPKVFTYAGDLHDELHDRDIELNEIEIYRAVRIESIERKEEVPN